MHSHYPSYLEPWHTSWRRTWTTLGATGDADALLMQLLTRYAEPQRRYHTQRHLSECLAHLEPALALATHAAEVEMALWFHDAIYDVHATDNELQSALWAHDALHAAGVQPQVAARIQALVLATRHDAQPETPDAQLLVDVDLSILGASAERFDAYEEQIRQEYAWVPDSIFYPKRQSVLMHFMARTSIYSTGYFRDKYELAARHNLQRSITRLEALLI